MELSFINMGLILITHLFKNKHKSSLQLNMNKMINAINITQ